MMIINEGDPLSNLASVLRKAERRPLLLYGAAALLALGFGGFTFLTAGFHPEPSAVIFALLFFLAQILLISEKRFDAVTLLGAAVCLACACYARVRLLHLESDDFTSFLSVWVEQLSALSVRDALVTPIGDYNLPYLYFLLLVSRLNVAPIIAIKAFSCFFDLLMAFFAMKTLSLVVSDRRVQLCAYLVTFSLPTVIMNSAHWAQCDSVYVCFCILSLYGAMKGNGRLCAAAWTAAFCFKLQAIFILPALFIALVMGRVKLRHLLWIPAVFALSLLPALIAGRSLSSCLSIYLSQTGEYPRFALNAPTIWQLFEGLDFGDAYSFATVMLAGEALLLFMYFCLTGIKSFTPESLLRLAFLSSMLVPYVLPRMHERYFYMADVLSFLYFLTDRKKWYIPAAMILSSVSSYVYVLSGAVDFNQKYVAVVFLVILAAEMKELFSSFRGATGDIVSLMQNDEGK